MRGELGSQTGRFHESVGRYADVIEQADTLESLAGVVREMVEESRTVMDVALDCGGQHLMARITRRSATALKLAPGVSVYAIIKSMALEDGERPRRR